MHPDEVAELGVGAFEFERGGGLAGESAGLVRWADGDRETMAERAFTKRSKEGVRGGALRTHDKEVRGPGAQEDAPEGETPCAHVSREHSDGAQLPGVEGDEGGVLVVERDHEETWVATRGARFEHGWGGSVAGRPLARQGSDEAGEVGARGRADRTRRARERDGKRAAEEGPGVTCEEGFEGVRVGEVAEEEGEGLRVERRFPFLSRTLFFPSVSFRSVVFVSGAFVFPVVRTVRFVVPDPLRRFPRGEGVELDAPVEGREEKPGESRANEGGWETKRCSDALGRDRARVVAGAEGDRERVVGVGHEVGSTGRLSGASPWRASTLPSS